MIWRVFPPGLDPATLPSHKQMAWQHTPDQPIDAVLVHAALGPEQWKSAAARLDPLVPLIALGQPPRHLQADAICSELSAPALERALASLAPVRGRMERLADLRCRETRDGDKLAILALSYTRDRPIEAQRQAAVPATVAYPLLLNRPGISQDDLWSTLEALASVELLNRRFAARVLTCPSCSSGRMSAFEACGDCGSPDLIEEMLLHHYRCGFQDGESAFLNGSDLTCPKCRHGLRHFGVDYGRPGSMSRCRKCRHVMTDPLPHFHCLDCGIELRGEEAQPRDWHHYSLTERAVTALLTGEFPAGDISAALGHHFPRTHLWKDFSLLVREQLRVASRYDRKIAVARIRITNLPDMRRALGASGASEVLRLFSQIVVENLRNSDLVTVRRDDTIAVAMP